MMIYKEERYLCEGWLQNDKRSRKGRFILKEGDSFVGEFINDMKHGHGNK